MGPGAAAAADPLTMAPSLVTAVAVSAAPHSSTEACAVAEKAAHCSHALRLIAWFAAAAEKVAPAAVSRCEPEGKTSAAFAVPKRSVVYVIPVVTEAVEKAATPSACEPDK